MLVRAKLCLVVSTSVRTAVFLALPVILTVSYSLLIVSPSLLLLSVILLLLICGLIAFKPFWRLISSVARAFIL